MITRILILHCDYCHRTTRIKGGSVTDEGLTRKAIERGWKATPHPSEPASYSPDARCPSCAKRTDLGTPWGYLGEVTRG